MCNSANSNSFPSSFFNRNYSWNGSKLHMPPTINPNWRVNNDRCCVVQSAHQEPASVYYATLRNGRMIRHQKARVSTGCPVKLDLGRAPSPIPSPAVSSLLAMRTTRLFWEATFSAHGKSRKRDLRPALFEPLFITSPSNPKHLQMLCALLENLTPSITGFVPSSRTSLLNLGSRLNRQTHQSHCNSSWSSTPSMR